MIRMGVLALHYAVQEMNAGAAEIGGNNKGPFVERYLNALHPEQITHRELPWCAAFWSWCWLQAGRELGQKPPVPYSRSCSKLVESFEADGKLHRPGVVRLLAPGDAVFWDFASKGSPQHVNMVVEVRDGILYTIGGNEGDEPSGAPVRIKRRGRLEDLKHLHSVGITDTERATI